MLIRSLPAGGPADTPTTNPETDLRLQLTTAVGDLNRAVDAFDAALIRATAALASDPTR